MRGFDPGQTNFRFNLEGRRICYVTLPKRQQRKLLQSKTLAAELKTLITARFSTYIQVSLLDAQSPRVKVPQLLRQEVC